jgi:hypothetical protein
MKKLLFILLSVVLIGNDGYVADREPDTVMESRAVEPETGAVKVAVAAKNQQQIQSVSKKAKTAKVSYSPRRVVRLAIAKCKAGGMVTTEQHLKDNLKAGKITKKEYKEYYPLDGLEDSFYSVFVNTDLNKAATTSGRSLGSEKEIAQYLADMLLLESDSVFEIRYAGKTKTSGGTFYEFRCYR